MASKQDVSRLRQAKGADGKESQRLQPSHRHHFVGPVGGHNARMCGVRLRIPAYGGGYSWVSCEVKEPTP